MENEYKSRMLNIDDICKILHCSKETVRNRLFARADFPLVDITKQDQVEENAFWAYIARGVRITDYL